MEYLLEDYEEISKIANKIHDDNFNSFKTEYSLSIYEAYKIAIELFKCHKLGCIDQELEIIRGKLQSLVEKRY